MTRTREQKKAASKRLTRAVSVACVAATLSLLAACGETGSAPEPDSESREPSVVYEMTLPETKQEPPEPEENTEAAPPDPNPEEDSQQATGGPENNSLTSYGKVVTVERVVDGDTIEVSPVVEGISEVRLIGVDTPETYGGAESFGAEASEFTKQALSGQRVALELDAEKIDPFGRLLAYAYLPSGEMFNETLVEEGYAQVATFPPNVKYVDRFLEAQREARQQNLGLWGLPQGKLCQLADRGNEIGGGCSGSETESAPSESPLRTGTRAQRISVGFRRGGAAYLPCQKMAITTVRILTPGNRSSGFLNKTPPTTTTWMEMATAYRASRCRRMAAVNLTGTCW